MFGRKAKEKERPPRQRRADNLSQFGLMDVPGLDDMGSMDNPGDEDADLEAELAGLLAGGGGGRQPRKPKQMPVENLDKMVADCMKDYDSAEEFSDTDDPDLLAELDGLDDAEAPAPVEVAPLQQPVYAGESLLSIIQSRMSLYREAIDIAKFNGDNSKVRRFDRGLKTLVAQERAVRSGQAVNEDDIPPQISVGKRKEPEPEPEPEPAAGPPPYREAPPPVSAHQPPPPVHTQRAAPPPVPAHRAAPPSIPPHQGEVSKSTVVERRRQELKSLAMAAKNNGDKATALEYVKRIKYCDQFKEQLQAGVDVDLTALPGVDLTAEATRESSSAPPPAVRSFSRDDPIQIPSPSQGGEEGIPPPAPELFGAPPPPSSILEALTQRFEKYKGEEAKAKESGNHSKARRMGRIVKQYQDAIKMHRAGRPIPRGELPDPPGFAPIPVQDTPGGAAGKMAAPAPPAAAASAAAPQPSAAEAVSPPKPSAAQAPKVARQSSVMSLRDKQQMALEKRQKLFKEAALQAKQQGQMDMAREYLKQALSLNKLVEVSKAGLPVDMATLPVPPQMQVKTNMEFEIISKEDCQVTGDREEMYSKLEQDLIAQVKMCMSNRTYFKEVGDISSSNKFEQMAVHAKKDLDSVRFAFKRGDPVPKFHYETRAFSRVVSHTELTDNDLELTIMAGINYVVKNPKDVDTYVRWEFPFPRDAPVVDKTPVVKDTNNPEYDAKFMLVINPRDKNFQRTVKRSAVKLEVWSKGGFLRSDTLVGTASVKLAPLERACEVHDSFDLYEGRKPVGGKVEVRLRLRNPVISKQIEQAQEKWLVVKF